MSPSVDVIVDRRDDIATVWALRELLRLRFDCRQQLTPEEFARVERLLVGSLRTMGGRWWSVG